MLSDYLEQLLGSPKAYHNTQKGLQANWCCPWCSDKRFRFFINLDRKVCYCHNCGYSASSITFISDYNRISWKDALSIFREYEGYRIVLPRDLETEIYEKLYASNINPIQNKVVIPLPDEFRSLNQTDNQAFKYLKSRLPWISLDEIEQRGIGYCEVGNYSHRVIFPFTENNEMVYWQARSWLPEPKDFFKKKVFRKVLNPSLSEEEINKGKIAIEKSEVIYNLDSALSTGMIVICEGIIDALTIGEVGIAINGKHLSDSQFTKLVSKKDNIFTLLIMLDEDAFENALYMAERLYGHFEDVLIGKLPKEHDPNSLGRKGCLEVIQNAEPYTRMTAVKYKLQGGF